MKILHICWGLAPNNGAANVARLILEEQRKQGHEVSLVSCPSWREVRAADEVWCHCGWYWRIWLAVALARGKVIWLPAGSYDPLRLAYHGWKKRLAGPFERWALRHADVIRGTCAAEADWIRAYEPRAKCVEVLDVKRFCTFAPISAQANHDPLHVLYLGRPHPLKGTVYLERAVSGLAGVELHEVSDKTGAALEAEWAWCDVLCLPTLSDNFGLVVAEALERGKRVITTDGAPAWENQPGVTYLRGFREGSDDCRVNLLREALQGELK